MVYQAGRCPSRLPDCRGKVRLWMRGDDVLRVTARKDQWGEVEEWICNECRFEKKKVSDWVIEGPTQVDSHSVIICRALCTT